LDALLLAGVALWCFLTALAGGLVGLVLGNIRLPVIVLAASSPAAGAGANIGISALAALAATITHMRAGRIDWRIFMWMAPPSVGGAVGGGLLSGAIPSDALLIAIGGILLAFGLDLLRPRRRAERSRPDAPDPRAAVVAGAAIGVLGAAGVLGHLYDGVDWTLLGIGAAASIPGSVLGARLTGRLDERQLLRAVGMVLLIAGVAMIVEGAV
jgi:uncharacterized membrane protein YfcA